MPAVNASTAPSIRTCWKRGIFFGLRPPIASMPQIARSRPNPPPIRARSTLSASIWNVSRLRLAPSAARTAISLRRPAARASSKFARFAQVIKRTKPTAPSRSQRVPRYSPTALSKSCVNVIPLPAFESGKRASSPLQITLKSAFACSIETPSFSRAIPYRPGWLDLWFRYGRFA